MILSTGASYHLAILGYGGGIEVEIQDFYDLSYAGSANNVGYLSFAIDRKKYADFVMTRQLLTYDTRCHNVITQ